MRYTDERKAKILATARDKGVPAAASRHRCAQSTVRKWLATERIYPLPMVNLDVDASHEEARVGHDKDELDRLHKMLHRHGCETAALEYDRGCLMHVVKMLARALHSEEADRRNR
jgi:transposase-like protein